MKASVGDRLVIRGHRVGEHERVAVILEVKGDDGGPPFLVKWLDDEHEGIVFPGADAVIEHAAPAG
jgi:hypothetical protein